MAEGLSPGRVSGQSPGALYQERLGTVQDALDWIDDGDCLTWSTHGSEPKVFLEHLHTIAPGWRRGLTAGTPSAGTTTL
ncbi:MAG: hypothetical protein ACLR1T_09840 [Evtepia gabavorous]